MSTTTDYDMTSLRGESPGLHLALSPVTPDLPQADAEPVDTGWRMSVSSCGPPQQVPLPGLLNPLSSGSPLGSTAWFNRLLSQCEPQQSVQEPELSRTASQRVAAALATTIGPLSTSQPKLATLPPSRTTALESTPYAAPGLDGPQPLVSVFAGNAPAISQAAELPTADRLRELPELPSSLFPLSGTLQPLVSAFAAAAEGEAFEAQGWPTTAETSVSAPAALAADNLEQSLPAIPLQHTCPCSTQVSLNPVIWRHFEPPHQIMVHAGLRTAVEEGEVSFPLSIYSSLNPRVITTGMHSSSFLLQCELLLQVCLGWPPPLQSIVCLPHAQACSMSCSALLQWPPGFLVLRVLLEGPLSLA